jgi:hypothetical protein
VRSAAEESAAPDLGHERPAEAAPEQQEASTAARIEGSLPAGFFEASPFFHPKDLHTEANGIVEVACKPQAAPGQLSVHRFAN